MARLKWLVLTSFVLLSLLGLGSVLFMNHFLNAPLSKQTDTISYTLSQGTGANTMIYQLQKQGVLNRYQAKLLSWWICVHGNQKSLKAGEYQFSRAITPANLVAKFINGDVVIHTITIFEGTTMADALMRISQHPAIKKTLNGKSQEEIVALLSGENTSLEGLIFPDTYHFTANISDLVLLKKAFQAMQEKLNVAWEKRDPNIIVKTPYEALILASIIEKETSIDEERYIISGVFQRRLAKNMRLQADPTVAYGLGKALTGNLTRTHLKLDTPYNTYLHKGLPPTPIALPGIKSIDAALHPDKSNALYFVATGNGRHYFTESLLEHNQAVERYRQSQLAKISNDNQSNGTSCARFMNIDGICSFYLH